MRDRNLILVCAAGVLLSGAGCARRVERGLLPNMVVPVSCASAITLMRCDASVSPPKCKSVKVTYRKGCEQIVAVKGE